MNTGLKLVGVSLALVLAGSNVAAQATAPADPLLALKTAAEAARLGVAMDDAWTLALAVRLRRATPVTAVDRKPDGVEESARFVDPSIAWLAKARDLGRYDKPLQAFLDEVEAGVFRGRRGGPRVSTADLAPTATHRYRETFQASQPAAVYVEGDGDTDLSLEVIGADGAAACRETGPGDVKLCAWTPRAGGSYVIEVVNRGPVRNRYALATN